MGPSSTRWEPAPAEAAAETLTEAGISSLAAAILSRRGVSTPEEAERFLSPDVGQLSPAKALPDMEAAVACLVQAREAGQKVAIVGDYDVDGVSATALLTATFRARGLEVETILPHRLEEGYGFQICHVERAVEKGCSVVVTADCGSTAGTAVGAALERGLKVVVTDHHLPGEPLPEGALHVNPKAAEDGPGQELCGAGIALKLALAFGEATGEAFPPQRLLHIAALGTIADVVPLVEENRIIAALGLKILSRTKSRGLRALIHQAGVKLPVRASDVGFRIGPRLNAAGRLGSADDALEILLTRDGDRAVELAKRLDGWNRERQGEERRALEEARKQIFERAGIAGATSGKLDPEQLAALPRILVAWSENWHQGVVGIAAGRLARELHRPAVLLAVDGEEATGSGRSIKGLHLHAFLDQWSEDLARFGGHAQAVGMTVETQKLETLRSTWEGAAAEWSPELLVKSYRYDAALTAREVSEELLLEIESLEPFGEGSPRPLLKVGPLKVDGRPRRFSQRHLSARARGEAGPPVQLLGWGWAERARDLEGRFEILAYLERDHYRGGASLRLLDARPI